MQSTGRIRTVMEAPLFFLFNLWLREQRLAPGRRWWNVHRIIFEPRELVYRHFTSAKFKLYAGQSAPRRQTSRFVIARSLLWKEKIGFKPRVIFLHNIFSNGYTLVLKEPLNGSLFVVNIISSELEILKAKVVYSVARGKTKISFPSRTNHFWFSLVDWYKINPVC